MKCVWAKLEFATLGGTITRASATVCEVFSFWLVPEHGSTDAVSVLFPWATVYLSYLDKYAYAGLEALTEVVHSHSHDHIHET